MLDSKNIMATINEETFVSIIDEFKREDKVKVFTLQGYFRKDISDYLHYNEENELINLIENIVFNNFNYKDSLKGRRNIIMLEVDGEELVLQFYEAEDYKNFNKKLERILNGGLRTTR